MEAVEILNNYRHPLASDPLGTFVLSSLLRSGALSENELQEQIASDAIDVRRKVDQLFRASLLELAVAGQLRPTELGKAVLSSLGITSAAVQALLEAFPLTENEHLLLSTLVEACDEPTSHTSSMLSLLHTAAAITKMDADYFRRTSMLARYLRAAIVGLSPAASWLDSTALCQSISIRLTSANDLGSERKRHPIITKFAMSACDQLKSDVQRSNSYFILGARGSGKSSILVKHLSQTRVISALSSGHFDNQLHLLYYAGHGSESIASMLTDTDFLVTCQMVLMSEGLLSGNEAPSEVADYARERLARIVTFDTPVSTSPVNRNSAQQSHLSRVASTPKPQPLVEQLQAIVGSLASAELSLSEREKLKSALSELRRILRMEGSVE